MKYALLTNLPTNVFVDDESVCRKSLGQVSQPIGEVNWFPLEK